MKRFAAVCIIPLVLACFLTASASGAGSSGDPVVSLSYLSGAYLDTLKADGAALVDSRLASERDRVTARLDELYREFIGYRLAPRFTELYLSEGNRVNLASGASFMLTDGSAVLTVMSGAAVNATTGYEVASESLLSLNQRYICTEDTTAVITALSDSAGYVDGRFTTDGKVDPNKTVFTDVRRYDWFFPAVDYVYNSGLFAGTSDDTFTPSGNMTRAMFVTVLHRLEGKPVPLYDAVFTDVNDPEQYYFVPVLWASETGVVAGYDDGTFMPDNSITREQMALIMYRYAVYKGYDTYAEPVTFDLFPDKSDVSDYAYNAMVWATAHGVINGSDGYLVPQGTATRAQVAQIVYNFCTIIVTPDIIDEQPEQALG